MSFQSNQPNVRKRDRQTVKRALLPRRQRRQRGSVLLYAALLSPLLLGLCGLAADYAMVEYHRARLQDIADAAALHGATGVTDVTWHGRAWSIIGDNTNDGFTPTAQTSDIQLGFWNTETLSFSAEEGETRHDHPAVRVTVRHSAPTLLAAYFGKDTVDLTATAIARATPGSNKEHFYYAALGKKRIFADGTADFDSYSSEERRTFPGSNGSGDREFQGGTNGTIDLDNGVEIWGDFFSDPNAHGTLPNSMFKSGGKHGTIDYEIEFETPEVPAGATHLGEVHITDGDWQLEGGDYVIDQLTIDSAAQWSPAGAVAVYLRGDATIDGRVYTHNTLPGNLRIVQTANADIRINAPHSTSKEHEMLADIFNPYGLVQLDGKVDFYGRIWADELGLTKGSDFFGDTTLTMTVTDDFAAAMLVK